MSLSEKDFFEIKRIAEAEEVEGENITPEELAAKFTYGESRKCRWGCGGDWSEIVPVYLDGEFISYIQYNSEYFDALDEKANLLATLICRHAMVAEKIVERFGNNQEFILSDYLMQYERYGFLVTN